MSEIDGAAEERKPDNRHCEKVADIPVAACRPSATARPIKDGHVLLLMSSIVENGLRQPINVRPVDDGFEVRGGRHRLEAFKRLGRETIPALVRDDDDLRAELAEIDENLIRADLSAAERALSISRRKAIYEVLHPSTVHGGPRSSSRQVGDLLGSTSVREAERFTRATADAVGASERTIQRDAQRGEQIGAAALSRLVGSSLDTGEELDALARLQPEHRERLIARAGSGEDVSAKRGDGALPNGARSIMGSRREADDSLDYSPTPPWATRALIERVFPAMNISRSSLTSVHEPAAGEGHMAEVLREYFPIVSASDVYDYGCGNTIEDFLDDQVKVNADWIITNPPFKNRAEHFALKAIAEARVGTAIFARLQWLETIGRYERLFQDNAPTQIAFFAERVNLCMGRWEPVGGTATAYIWLVWIKGRSPRAPFWIPPDCRKTLSRADDVERFTAHPVIRVGHSIEHPPPAEPPQVDANLLEIPNFLRRGHADCSAGSSSHAGPVLR